MIGVLAARNNLRVKNARQPVKEKMFKCLGQGHKNKENREMHSKSYIFRVQEKSVLQIVIWEHCAASIY